MSFSYVEGLPYQQAQAPYLQAQPDTFEAPVLGLGEVRDSPVFPDCFGNQLGKFAAADLSDNTGVLSATPVWERDVSFAGCPSPVTPAWAGTESLQIQTSWAADPAANALPDLSPCQTGGAWITPTVANCDTAFHQPPPLPSMAAMGAGHLAPAPSSLGVPVLPRPASSLPVPPRGVTVDEPLAGISATPARASRKRSASTDVDSLCCLVQCAAGRRPSLAGLDTDGPPDPAWIFEFDSIVPEWAPACPVPQPKPARSAGPAANRPRRRTRPCTLPTPPGDNVQLVRTIGRPKPSVGEEAL
eukprot:gene3349-3846_t